MIKRLALTNNGTMTYCTSSEENIGKGRCNHIMHQNNGEDAASFTKRVEFQMVRFDKKVSVNFKPSLEELKNEKLLLDGIQDKWYANNCFVKADLDAELNDAFRQERNALSEELVSILLDFSDLDHAKYECKVLFDECGNDMNIIAASSQNFLKENEELFAFSDLLTSEQCDEMELGETNDYSPQFNNLRAYVKDKTGLDVGMYVLRTISLDIITMNPDRHLGNIALIRNKDNNTWKFSPIFDNGQALLASKEFDTLSIDDSWDYEEHQTPSTFGMGPIDDYHDLISNIITSKDAIRIKFKSARQSIMSYQNTLYEKKFVERAKDLLIQRLEDYQNILWIDIE